MTDEIDDAILGRHLAVRALEQELEHAKDRRAIAYALANEKGKTSGDIARLLGVPPMQVRHIIKTGQPLLAQRRFIQQGRQAA